MKHGPEFPDLHPPQSYFTLPPRERRSIRDAHERVVDGQSMEDAMTEALIELGHPSGEARRVVEDALRQVAAGAPGS